MKARTLHRTIFSRSRHRTIALMLGLLASLLPLRAQQSSSAPHADTSSVSGHAASSAAADRGPVLSSSELAQGAILLHFDHAEGGVHLKSPGRGAFEIAGADHVWFPAEAHLVNGIVVVSTSLVQQPVVVRYRWTQRDTAALFDGENVPAAPFQTDK